MSKLSSHQESPTSKRNSKSQLHGGRILSSAVLVAAIVFTTIPVSAVDYNAEIQRLQNQNTSNNANRQQLQTTAETLEQKIANLQASIVTIDTQIRTNEAKQVELAQKIKDTESEIVRQQDLLKITIRQLYIDNGVSMIEKVASSKNLSEYVEKEEYTISVQSKIQESLDRINKLKKQQQEQKDLVEKLIGDNKAMQQQLGREKEEVGKLLAMNQDQQASYTETIAANNDQISDLQREQAEENARFLREQAALAEAARKRAAAAAAAARAESRSSNAANSRQQAATPAPAAPRAAAAPTGVRAVDGRAYPYAGARWPNNTVDPWGMYQRQCVSYTAWKVAASGRHMPYWGGRGNAKNWDDNARRAGIPVDRNPRVGDVAVRNAGTYGHVMYVEAVHGDGSISISQYNASWTGTYSEARIFPGDLVFIHF